MPLPASKTRLKRVGQALAAGTATADDERLYREFLRTCDDALAKVTARLAQSGLTAVVRVKTRDTMVDKLRRQPSLALSTMDDVAGCRLVLDGDRDTQDRTVEQVRELFNRDGASAEVKDRRAFPSYGYRAVHVLVRLDDVRIEVQVRTQLQHLWAELSEKFADRVGRHVRYGGRPPTRGSAKHLDCFRRWLRTSTRRLSAEADACRPSDDARPTNGDQGPHTNG